MANPEHLEILKQGVDVWNEWRRMNPRKRPDLSNASLRMRDLRDVDLRFAKLSGANLMKAKLSRSHLQGADLSDANLHATRLTEADLTGANLTRTDLSFTLLARAKLLRANLSRSQFRSSDLSGADLQGALLYQTAFYSVDLSRVLGLPTVHHRGPSFLDVMTILLSARVAPTEFFERTGIPTDVIPNLRDMSRQHKDVDYYSCFISYSSKDQSFAEHLHADLQARRVRVWFAPHDMKIGAHIRPAIDESIRLHDKLLLVLSKASVGSQWVEQEVETALAREREQEGKTVLFPIRVDDAIMEMKSGWPALLRNTRNVGDFTRWKDHDSYRKAFDRLLRDLKAGA